MGWGGDKQTDDSNNSTKGEATFALLPLLVFHYGGILQHGPRTPSLLVKAAQLLVRLLCCIRGRRSNGTKHSSRGRTPEKIQTFPPNKRTAGRGGVRGSSHTTTTSSMRLPDELVRSYHLLVWYSSTRMEGYQIKERCEIC